MYETNAACYFFEQYLKNDLLSQSDGELSYRAMFVVSGDGDGDVLLKRSLCGIIPVHKNFSHFPNFCNEVWI